MSKMNKKQVSDTQHASNLVNIRNHISFLISGRRVFTKEKEKDLETLVKHLDNEIVDLSTSLFTMDDERPAIAQTVSQVVQEAKAKVEATEVDASAGFTKGIIKRS